MGIEANPKKVKVIRELPNPKAISEVCSFHQIIAFCG